MSKVTHYVCGLLFSVRLGEVVLIRKKRPAWQAGKLNGVGGKVEPGESPHQAMVREFREEAGLQIEKWSHFAKLSGADYQVWFYCATGDTECAHTNTDEVVSDWSARDVINSQHPQAPKFVESLTWLVPLAQGFLRNGSPAFTHFRDSGTDQAKEGAR